MERLLCMLTRVYRLFIQFVHFIYPPSSAIATHFGLFDLPYSAPSVSADHPLLVALITAHLLHRGLLELTSWYPPWSYSVVLPLRSWCPPILYRWGCRNIQTHRLSLWDLVIVRMLDHMLGERQIQIAAAVSVVSAVALPSLNHYQYWPLSGNSMLTHLNNVFFFPIVERSWLLSALYCLDEISSIISHSKILLNTKWTPEKD